MIVAREPRLCRRILGRRLLGLAVVLAVVMLVGWRSIFIVDETRVAVVRSFGRACNPPIVQAGLGVKRPWQTVHLIDRRVRMLTLESREKLTGDHEHVVVQPCVYWRVSSDAAECFLRSVGDDASAEAMLSDLVWQVLDRELAERPLTDWLNPSGDRDPTARPPLLAIAAKVAQACQPKAFARFGIDLLDVQFYQFNLPENMTDAMLRIMQADQHGQIDRRCLEVDLRQARLAADARRQADQILADAEDQAARIRAEGRREVNRLEHDARAIDPDLADYLLQLEGYRRLSANGLPSEPQASATKTKPASTGQTPTPNAVPVPQSGKKTTSMPG